MTPHWMFARWSRKYLDDFIEVYGDDAHISTIVRYELLAQEMSEVYSILDKFRPMRLAGQTPYF